MKQSVLKGIALCALALSLLFVGMTTVGTAESGTVVYHDGPHDNGVVK